MNGKEKLKKIINNKNNKLFIGIIVILSGYIFFFNSQKIFNSKQELKNTDINTTIEMEDRQITLAKWVYCPETEIMEVEFDIINNSYDGNDEYKFTAINRAGDKFNTTVIFTSPTISVIRLSGIKPDFSELRVSIDIDTETEHEPAKFYVSQDKVEIVSEIQDYENLNAYYVSKLNRYISNYKSEIEEIQKNLSEANEKVQNFNDLINNLEMQKNYAAGDELNNLNKQISDVNKQLISINSEISKYESDIKDIEEKISDYEAIKMIYE